MQPSSEEAPAARIIFGVYFDYEFWYNNQHLKFDVTINTWSAEMYMKDALNFEVQTRLQYL